MPNLRHLLDDLDDLNIRPEKVHIQAQIYDDIVTDAEASEENSDEDE